MVDAWVMQDRLGIVPFVLVMSIRRVQVLVLCRLLNTVVSDDIMSEWDHIPM